MSLSYIMSHFEFKKCLCRPVDFRGQGPYIEVKCVLVKIQGKPDASDYLEVRIWVSIVTAILPSALLLIYLIIHCSYEATVKTYLDEKNT